MTGFGLSPRVRGNLRSGDGQRRQRGSIPACAGEPSPQQSGTGIEPVYPRVCGGTGSPRRPERPGTSLSPRVRGNRPWFGAAIPRKRSIPACAGEPTKNTRPSDGLRVYPRVCGGTTALGAGQWPGYGLSPRVRGNRPAAGGGVLLHRSIPACAGEPAQMYTLSMDGGNRHVCGQLY